MTDYAKLTHASPFAIKRLAHQARFHNYCTFLKNNINSDRNLRVLDYGSGDGYLFNRLRSARISSFEFHAYEPVPSQLEQLKVNVKNNDLKVVCHAVLAVNERFDIVICAEVLEHFSASNVLLHINKMKSHLTEAGKLLISVPIEIGLAGAAKNMVRALIKQSHPGLDFGVAIKSFLNKPVFRGQEDYICSHVGFSYKNLEYLLVDAGLIVQKKYFSPFPFMGPLANSQVFFECSVR